MKGANKTAKSPDGKPLIECTENEEIIKLLR